MQHLSWEKVKTEVMNPKISRKVVSGERLTMAHISFAKDAVVPTHHHESEQITYVVEGVLKFQLDGREVTVGKGEVLVIPSNVPHSAVALENTEDLEIFSPIRHDWLTGTDDYLRQR